MNRLCVLFCRLFIAGQQRVVLCAQGEVQDRHRRLPIAVYAYSKKDVLKSFIRA
ncbi:hypothetical protein ALP36_102603 [Pseudomonas syringae pv. coriandricola]|uniref:Uncharacterized protein n=1 Tax=Pseudomonas syringae pv. coriandricola TaxID=264453 RepID=A0A3M4UBZ9_9PSED|nr:hypothetical protein ALP87_102527 [Pseudomonas syringae pv. coriandricola]RMU07539.1 hypothetical protein ALP36_102603 [Pseudomonas syringae pv. coriandricola]